MNRDGAGQIIHALNVIYEPRSDNGQRQQAQAFLDGVKRDTESPFYGYQLAKDSGDGGGNENIIRHFGLSLLQNTITHDLYTFNKEKIIMLRSWIIELSMSVSPSDPHYIKEKIAFLWVLIAKRLWGSHLTIKDSDFLDGWIEMDENLCTLWSTNYSTRELSLIIFRTLLEDIYILDDPIAAKRNSTLNQLIVLIVTPDDVLASLYDSSQSLQQCKFQSSGWFINWSKFLLELLHNDSINSPNCQNFVPKILSIYKTCLHWIQPCVLKDQNILQTLLKLLSLTDTKIKTLSIDCLHILLTRDYHSHLDFDFFISSIFTTEGIHNLRDFYCSLNIDPDNIDEQVYALLKKTVEMIVSLSEYLNISSKQKISWEKSDIDQYLKLVLETTNHPSLIVSGLSLQMWVTVLRYDDLSSKKPIDNIILNLLDSSANKTIDYTFDDDSNMSKKYLDVDFDSTPDSASFLSNFKKFNEDIVRISVCKKPESGLKWLESKLHSFFDLDLGRQCIHQYNLEEKSIAMNHGISQFNIIENCVRGISRWRIWYNGEDFDALNDRLNKLVESLGERLLVMNVASPILIRKQVQTLVQFAPLLKDVSPLMFQVLEKILTTATFEYPPDSTDDEKELIRDLRTSCGTELNRLAYIMPEALKKIFTDLENVVANILTLKKVTDHEIVAFKSFLLVIASRSSINDKDELFAKIVDPELAAWSAPETEKGLMDLHWFMERMGIVEIASYFQRRGITANTNLLEATMDDEGKELKTKLKDHWSSIFPIRATRIFIQYSIEKLGHDSTEYINLLKLWKPRVQPIIPHILQLLTQIQAYHNPENWKDLPDAVQSFVRYSCLERFWQQGVSIQSKETFIEENVKAALTLRDFADSVGHLIRYTREYAFLTIGSLTQLEDTFYEIPGIAGVLWKSVAGDTIGVTLHSWKHMINSCLRSVVKNCPIKFVDTFMGELLPKVFNDFDELLVRKWEKVYQHGLQLQGNEDDETLSEEMMEEHMLRQLTATVVRFLMDVVSQLNAKNMTDAQVAMRKLIVENKEIMAPFLKICCHIIGFKDTKCSFNTILVVRHLLQEILLKDNEVDVYICDNLMKVLLGVLMDDYFIETHSEAAVTLTTLYCSLRSKNDYPARILIQSLPNITTQHISNFESILIGSKSLNYQRSAMLELIKIAKEVDGEDDMAKRKKQLEDNAIVRKKKNTTIDVMNDPFTENGALNNLFGED